MSSSRMDAISVMRFSEIDIEVLPFMCGRLASADDAGRAATIGVSDADHHGTIGVVANAAKTDLAQLAVGSRALFDAAAKKDDIPLTRAQFLRIFAGATAIQLPK